MEGNFKPPFYSDNLAVVTTDEAHCIHENG